MRAQLEELAFVNTPSQGSQFRSRDLFSQACKVLLAGQSGALAARLEPGLVPEVPASAVAYVDSFGNLKATLQARDLPPRLRARIGEVVREVTVAAGSFGVAQGQLCLAPGSSGWRGPDGERLRWLELFLRVGSAYEAFERLTVGSVIGL